MILIYIIVHTLIYEMSQSVIIDDQEYEYDYVTDSFVLKNPVLSNDVLFESYVHSHTGTCVGTSTGTITNEMMGSYSPEFWSGFLKRELTRDEMKIFHTIWAEDALNNDIKKLQQVLKKKNYVIKCKTNNNGNCLFESLKALDIGINNFNIPEEEFIRLQLSDILYKESNNRYFFPNNTLSPKEIYSNINVEYTINYEQMLNDLKTNHSWKKLPGELILMGISKVYNVSIIIHHNKSDYQNIIDCCDSTESGTKRVIHLGQINEEHYLPVVEYFPDTKYENIEYTTGIEMFEKWVLCLNS